MQPQPYIVGYAPVEQRAIWSLVFGLLGLFCVPVVFSVVAIVLGVQALDAIKASNGTLGGQGRALAGVTLGAVELVLVAVFVTLFVIFAIA